MAQDETITVKYHKVVAGWTRVLGIFTVVLAVTSSAQWYMMMKANQDTREYFLASQRPTIATSSEGGLMLVGWVASNGKPETYKIGYHLINSGNSVAIVKKYAIATCALPCMPDQAQDITNLSTSLLYTIGPKSRTIIQLPISADVLAGTAEPAKAVALLLYIEYQDNLGSGKTYHFAICEKISLRDGVNVAHIPEHNAGFDDLFESASCAQNNESD